MNVDPKLDIGIRYFTSGRLKEDFKTYPDNYSIDIVEITNTRSSALEIESLLIHAHISNQFCKNMAYDVVAYKRATNKTDKKSNVIPIGDRQIKKISRVKKKMIQAAIRADKLTKKTLTTYFDENLGCEVFIYPTSGIRNGKK